VIDSCPGPQNRPHLAAVARTRSRPRSD